MGFPLLSLAASLCVAASQPDAGPRQALPTDSPRNIILIIGDGMGTSHIAAASQFRHGTDAGLRMESMPITGLMKHHAADAMITDSAASATSMATGLKADNGAIGMTPDGERRTTIAEAAADQGLSVGVITNTYVFDATPACFLAHVPSRSHSVAIMAQMVQSDAALIVGGDPDYILNDGRRLSREQRPAWSAIPQFASQGGRRMDLNPPTPLFPDDQPVIILYPARDDTNQTFGPPLVDIVTPALQRLAKDPDGFLLIVESSDSDKGAHAHDAGRVITGVLELDDALEPILEFVRARDDTLVIVTADHETAGLTVAGGSGSNLDIRWSTGGHSLEWVPVFAEGTGAHRFSGVIDNTDIAKHIADLLNLQGVGDIIE